MIRDPLLRAFLALLALSLATTGLAALLDAGWAGPALGAAVLTLGFLKMRLILRRYLGLAGAPSFRGGVDLVLALLLALMFGLYLIPVVGG